MLAFQTSSKLFLHVKVDHLLQIILFAVVKAYQYTSLTSVMLLDCWAIPCVILLTWLFLKTKYGLRKFAGVVLCVAGLVAVVFSDVHASDRAQGKLMLMASSVILYLTIVICLYLG